MRHALCFFAAMLFLWSPSGFAQTSYSGDFTAAVQGGSLSLTLAQSDAKNVAGRLQGLGGAVFDLQGEVRPDGTVVGVAKGQGGGGLFFSGQVRGSELQIVFAEPDRTGKPNIATARSILFTRTTVGEAASQGGQEHLLQGMLCSFSGTGGAGGLYRHSLRAHFDGRGAFTYGSETTSSGYGGNVFAQNAGNRGRYRVAGNQVHLDFADGSSGVASVHFRQSDGRITELQYDGKLYGQGLCD